MAETPAGETRRAPLVTVRPAPCRTCPYRRDVPSGLWDAAEYAKLPGFDGDIPDQVAAGALSVFDCHQRTGDLCAGWAGCHDMTSMLAVRLRAREIDPAVYDYQSPVPLFASGAEAAEHGMRDIDHPGPEALAAITKLRRLRAALGDQWNAATAAREDGNGS